MHFFSTISAFTTLGDIHLAATVRQDTPEGATEVVLTLATDVPDDGCDAPDVFLRDACLAILEELSNRAPHAL